MPGTHPSIFPGLQKTRRGIADELLLLLANHPGILPVRYSIFSFVLIPCHVQPFSFLFVYRPLSARTRPKPILIYRDPYIQSNIHPTVISLLFFPFSFSIAPRRGARANRISFPSLIPCFQSPRLHGHSPLDFPPRRFPEYRFSPAPAEQSGRPC